MYDYYPGAQTLFARHFDTQTPAAVTEPVCPDVRWYTKLYYTIQQTLWTYIIQMSSALNAVHMASLAARFLNIHKVLVQGQSRYVHAHRQTYLHTYTRSILLSGSCMMDVLDFDREPPTPTLLHRQQVRCAIQYNTFDSIPFHSKRTFSGLVS